MRRAVINVGHEVCQVFLLLVSSVVTLAPLPAQEATVRASPGTIVQVEPPTSSANVSETFTINIMVVDVQNLYGLDITLLWDSSVVKPVGINVRLGQADGVLHDPLMIADNSTREGRYTLAATSINPAPSFNGSGNIVIIAFNITSAGNSVLDLSSYLADRPPPDGISQPISHITVDGTFEIIPEFPDTATLAALMFLVALIAVFSKRGRLWEKTASP